MNEICDLCNSNTCNEIIGSMISKQRGGITIPCRKIQKSRTRIQKGTMNRLHSHACYRLMVVANLTIIFSCGFYMNEMALVNCLYSEVT